MKNITCFHCLKKIIGIDYFMQALEKPYCNLFFHRDCLKEIEKNTDLVEYLTLKSELIYNSISNSRRRNGEKTAVQSTAKESDSI